jgi:rod shape-determining protein MreC
VFRLFERYQTAIVIFFTIALPVLAYRANAAEPANANAIDRLFLAATAPIKAFMSWATGKVSDGWYGYVDLRAARKDAGELKRRLMQAERARDEAKSLVNENTHLRTILGIKESNPKATLLAATVIAAGSSPLGRTVEIDRGSVDGVARGMAVISDAGLVGLVLRVGWTSSEVMLIADEKFTLSVVVLRSRARGHVKGSGLLPGFQLELTEILRADDVRVGDRLATSGLGGVFPRSIPVGEVTEVKTPTGAQHRVAEVEPFVDFARLEQVIVVIQAPKEEPLVTPEPLRPATLRSPGILAQARDAGASDAAAVHEIKAAPRRLDASVRSSPDADLSPDAAPTLDASVDPEEELRREATEQARTSTE